MMFASCVDMMFASRKAPNGIKGRWENIAPSSVPGLEWSTKLFFLILGKLGKHLESEASLLLVTDPVRPL